PAPSRGSWSWPACPTWAPASPPAQWGWTRSSRRRSSGSTASPCPTTSSSSSPAGVGTRRRGRGRAVGGSQVEVAVLGNDAPAASGVGEITFEGEFYDYHAKYEDPKTQLHIPA